MLLELDPVAAANAQEDLLLKNDYFVFDMVVC